MKKKKEKCEWQEQRVAEVGDEQTCPNCLFAKQAVSFSNTEAFLENQTFFQRNLFVFCFYFK